MKSLKKKSTCRLTGRPIELFLLTTDDVPAIWRTTNDWLYTDITRAAALELRTNDKVYPKPADFCWRNTYEGDPCTSKIRPENMRAQLWACGRHMAQFQEEQQRRLRVQEEDGKRAQREAFFEWQLEEAVRVYERLKELGWGAILPQEPPRRNWGTQIRGTEISLEQAEFLALVEEPEEEEYEDDDDFTTVEEDFFTGDL